MTEHTITRKDIEMTRDEILNMPAGREMDALIAEKVMGWTYNALGDAWTQTGSAWVGCDKFLPSTDITAAWQVVKKFYSLKLDKYSNGDEWRVYLVTSRDGKNVDANAVANAAPLAICRASLLAVTS